MGYLRLIFALVLPFSAARVPDDVIRHGEFTFPANSSQFPAQFQQILFNGSRNITLGEGNHELTAFFAIPYNETDDVHEIYLLPKNTFPLGTFRNFKHSQYLTLFSNAQSHFNWKISNRTTKLDDYSTPFSSGTDGLEKDKVKIQFYTNGTITYNGIINGNTTIKYDYIHGNYYFVPFSIEWEHKLISFILKMGSGIQLAFYEAQYDNPPRSIKWPLLPPPTTTTSTTTTVTPTPSTTETSSPTTPTPTSTTTTDTPIPSTTSSTSTTTIIPTTSSTQPEFEFSSFAQQNFDLLIIIAIVCTLIIFCFMFSIFLCCCFRCF